MFIVWNFYKEYSINKSKARAHPPAPALTQLTEKRPHQAQVFGVVVEMPLESPAPHHQGPGFQSGSTPECRFLFMCALRGSR